MKKRALLLPMVALTLLLTACGSKKSDSQAASSSSSSTSSKVESSSSHSSSSSSSQSSSSDQTSSNSADQMPKVTSGVTETKSGNANNFMVRYAKNGQTYATYTRKTYGSADSAQNAVQYYMTANDNKGLPTADLGYGIKGAKDAGAGQLYVNFQMGRWSLTVHGLNSQSNVAVTTAKSLVQQLQSAMLPVPNDRGSVMLDAETNTIAIQWQDGNTVNTLNGNNPTDTVALATSLK